MRTFLLLSLRFMTASTLVMTLLHRFRSIVLRRVLFILAILYLLRAVTMSITTLPVANPQYYCSPQLNMTDHFEWWNFTKTIVSRVSHMSLGMGLSVNGRHSFCGDYIFSGHTIMLVISKSFPLFVHDSQCCCWLGWVFCVQAKPSSNCNK